MELKVYLNSVDNVKEFVNIVSKLPYNCDLSSGRYVIDAKSIMGIFSMNLSKPLELHVHMNENPQAKEDILKKLQAYIV